MMESERAVKVARFAVQQAKKIVIDELGPFESKERNSYRIAVLNITNRIVDLLEEK